MSLSLSPSNHQTGKRTQKEGLHNLIESFPARACDGLFAERITVSCALDRECVPCAYKIGCFDVSLDQAFSRMIPNQRPEQCPRAKISSPPPEGALGYCSGMSVLTVGDGDFSFSLAVARLLSRNDKSGAKGLVATSYEARETLAQIYPNYVQTIAELETLGVSVCHNVDATRLLDTIPKHIKAKSQFLFHRIVWNFPCTAIKSGQDGQNDAMDDNKDLVRRFIDNARHLLCKDGEFHMCHKTKPPFNQWKLEEVALGACADEPTINYHGRIVLDRFTLAPYTPRKALDRKSFPCHDACTYVFGIETNSTTRLSKSFLSFPRTIPTNGHDFDETLLHNELPTRTLVPVTIALIDRIRKSHLDQPSPSRKTQQWKRQKK